MNPSVSSNGLPDKGKFDISKKNNIIPNGKIKEIKMSSKDEEIILKTVKEIVVKFIEVGNISPSSFHDHFRNIYNTVENTVRTSTLSPEKSKK
jgi:hypothetical protein